jgi:hypothetical protein
MNRSAAAKPSRLNWYRGNSDGRTAAAPAFARVSRWYIGAIRITRARAKRAELAAEATRPWVLTTITKPLIGKKMSTPALPR